MSLYESLGISSIPLCFLIFGFATWLLDWISMTGPWKKACYKMGKSLSRAAILWGFHLHFQGLYMTLRSSPPSLATLSRCRGVSLPPLSLGPAAGVDGFGVQEHISFFLAVRLGSHFMHIFQPGKPVDCFGTAGESSQKGLRPAALAEARYL